MQINRIYSTKISNIPYTSTKKEVITKSPITDNIEVDKKKKTTKAILSALGLAAAATGLYFIFRNKPSDDSGTPPSDGPSEPSSPAQGTPPIEAKPKWQEYTELQAELKQCNKDLKGLSDGEEKNKLVELRADIVKKIEDLEQRAITENFSLLEKKDLSNATEDERWKYFHDYAFTLMRHNEASAFDCIDMFEKYGMRKLLDPKMYIYNSTLEELMTSIPREPSDKLISRLIDVIDKFITIDKPNIAREVHRFLFTLEDYDFYNVEKYITETTLLKAIQLIKKMQFWTSDCQDVPFRLELRYCDFHFKNSPRLGEIKKAIAELEALSVKYCKR